ncbi:hypothetical protein BN2156_01242 [Mycolicibacterium neworleansense]|uniref:Uncharacterized protein n=2 Tax=Mycolicibacterium neworleansense TaxID=146018 RepID=A0A0H5RK63_9MYCO|nr:hypothetical protein BN2156_01242 [Mycolicibacterium neworleansense]
MMTSASIAGAAPTGTSDAQTTIGMLQAQGFRVMVSKVGHGPLNRCTVNAVRPGRKSSLSQNPLVGVRTRPQQSIAPTVYVDLTCDR